LAGRPYTVVTMRQGTDARLSTNFYHGTWHILSDWHGARLLGRLLWGLAYQRRPGTLVLIGPPFIDPNPFDGTRSRSSPIPSQPHPSRPRRSCGAAYRWPATTARSGGSPTAWTLRAAGSSGFGTGPRRAAPTISAVARVPGTRGPCWRHRHPH